MSDSSSFTSLFALVDNHLSKSNIHQDDSQPSTSGMGSFRMPQFNIQNGTSDTGIASTSRRYPIPRFRMPEHPVNDVLARQLRNLNTTKAKQPKDDDDDDDDSSDDESAHEPVVCMRDSTINDVLAMQLNNMFKAREERANEEKRRQEELRKVEENLKKQKQEDECLIDLMSAIQLPGQVHPQVQQYQMEDVNLPSISNNMESTPIMDTKDNEQDNKKRIERNLRYDFRNGGPLTIFDLPERSDSPKPICTDMSYILKHKMGKCSSFGKVLCARYKPALAPYFRIHVPPPVSHNIKVFDFSTPSPDDINLARQRNPSYYNNANRHLTVYE